MSRIGKSPVTLPKGIEVKVDGNTVSVKGPKGELTQYVDSCIKVDVKDEEIVLERESEAKDHRAKHGLYRALINNMILGVTEGFKQELELVGVGYRASNQGQRLEISVGFAHPIIIELPKDIKITTETTKGKPPLITLESHDKQLVSQVAAKIRSYRKPEPYKGKGIKYKGEYIRRKAGKAAGK